MAAKLGKPQVSNVLYVTDIAYILTDLSKVPQQWKLNVSDSSTSKYQQVI